jgi:uncharacterized membrane protein YwzB
MAIKIVTYLVTLLCTTFAMTGINFNNFFKKDHIWEARFFIAIAVMSISYLLTSFIFDIVSIFK